MLFNVIGYDNQVLGQIEAASQVEAWEGAGKTYSNILDVRPALSEEPPSDRRYQVKMSHYIPLRTTPYPPFGTEYGTGMTEYKTEYVTAKDEREARRKVYVPYGWQIDTVY